MQYAGDPGQDVGCAGGVAARLGQRAVEQVGDLVPGGRRALAAHPSGDALDEHHGRDDLLATVLVREADHGHVDGRSRARGAHDCRSHHDAGVPAARAWRGRRGGRGVLGWRE